MIERKALAGLILLLLATVAAYARIGSFDFVDFDDPVYVVENDMVGQGLTLEGLRWAFTASRASNWHPLTWISHMLDVELFGLRAGPHHLVSLGWHLLNVVLVFAFLRHASGRTWASLGAAALFALHPVNVESVAWIAERKSLISTAFGMAALLAWVRYTGTGRCGAYIAAWLALALGLMAKPMLVSLPFVMLLLDFWPLGRLQSGRPSVRTVGVEKLPMFALAAASSVATYFVQRAGGAVGTVEAIPIAARLANAVVSYASYLRKVLWPSDLAVLYQHPYSPGGQPPPTGQLLALALVLVGLSAIAVLARRRGWPLVGWLWFLGTLVPVIGLVQVGQQGMADRYLYLPAIGLFTIFAFASDELTQQRRTARMALIAAWPAVLVALAALTYSQTSHWKDSLALFNRALAVSPDNPVLHYNLGTSLERRGDVAGAALRYERALEIRPYDSSALLGLANTLAARGAHEAAIERYETVLELEPDRFDAAYNQANSLRELGRLDQAVVLYRRALEIDPDSFEARHNLGTALLAAGDPDAATRELARAAEIDPGSAAAQQNLALAHLRASRPREALAAFERASEIDPHWAAPLAGRAWIHATSTDPALREPAEATRLAERARELSAAADASILDTLSVAYAAAGQFERAVETAREAQRVAVAAGDLQRAQAIEAKLARFRAGQPWLPASPAR